MARKATRNAQCAGSIRQRADGTWEARYTVGRDPGTGKQLRKSVYGKTQKEVRLLWTDGPDIQNVIDEVSGTLHVEKGKVLSGTVLYGNRMVSSMLWTKKEVGSAPSFTFRPNMTVMSPAASYSVGFEDEIFGLSLSVASTIFQ